MALMQTDFQFPFDVIRSQGKVRDLYDVEGQLLVLVATDRVSAFDVVFPQTIPNKGQVLSSLSAFFFRHFNDICPHHLLSQPHPNVSIVRRCEPYPIEVVVRGHLCGHAWRMYRDGNRQICGVDLPEGLRENDPLPEPIVTPTTKSSIGHDMDITEDEITRSGLIPADEWSQIRYYALTLFYKGTEWAKDRGLILADAKYEFGFLDFQVYVIDEIHTPDAARYFPAEGFDKRQDDGLPQPQYSKEYLRQQLLALGFRGNEGQEIPILSEELIHELSQRYIWLYEQLTDSTFEPATQTEAEIQESVLNDVTRLLQSPT